MKPKYKIGSKVYISIPKVVLNGQIIMDLTYYMGKQYRVVERDISKINNYQYALESDNGEYIAWVYEGQLGKYAKE